MRISSLIRRGEIARLQPARRPFRPPQSPASTPARPVFFRSAGENRSVDVPRIAWLVTVGICLITVLILVLQGYLGYAAVTFAVALSAAINLF